MTRTTPRPPHRTQNSPASARAAFTIIELLMVIIIISILAALLLPVINEAREKARVTEVTTEMNRMETAIGQFESRFGVQPPSGIVLYEQREGAGLDPSWDADTSTAAGDLRRRTSRGLIRQIWPDFNFGVDHDFNQNGAIDSDPIYLNGAECLVFFLGGVTSANSTFPNGPFNVVGFASNPLRPELNDAAAENRIDSFHEFDAGRLVDVDLDRMPEYVDTLGNQQTPMLYFSSYDGRGYQPYGIDGMIGTDDDEILDNSLLGRGPFAVYYLTDDNSGDNTMRPDGNPWNPDSFQLVSPGRDGDYGYGGEYTSDNRLPDALNPEGQRAPTYIDAEEDNITNFRNERLVP